MESMTAAMSYVIYEALSQNGIFKIGLLQIDFIQTYMRIYIYIQKHLCRTHSISEA